MIKEDLLPGLTDTLNDEPSFHLKPGFQTLIDSSLLLFRPSCKTLSYCFPSNSRKPHSGELTPHKYLQQSNLQKHRVHFMDGSTVHTSITTTSQSTRDIFLKYGYTQAGGRRCKPHRYTRGCALTAFRAELGRIGQGSGLQLSMFVRVEHGIAMYRK